MTLFVPTKSLSLQVKTAADWLAKSATWRSVAGGAESAAAKRIIFGIGGTTAAGTYCAADGTTQTAAAPLAIVSTGSHERGPAGAGTFDRQWEVVIDLSLPGWSGVGATERDHYLYAVDLVAGILDDLELARMSGGLAWTRARLTSPPIIAPPTAGLPSWLTGTATAQLTLEGSRG